MKRPIFAANWKMNQGPSDSKAFMRTFLAHYARRPDRSVIFFPPALSFHAMAEAVKERHDILLGVQNIHFEDSGAYTGETSASMARDAGARLVLVGHSERRHVFGEMDEESAKKCAAAFRAGLIPMLCVGEKLEEREGGRTDEVVLRQLRSGVGLLDPAQIGRMLIAYEPVWAIGTGRTASPADAAAVHRTIHGEIRTLAKDHAGDVPILYGGSVNRGNARTLLAEDGIDGVLVGGASLDADAWAAIVRT